MFAAKKTHPRFSCIYLKEKIALTFLLMVSMCFSLAAQDTYQVSQPVQVTTNAFYERGQSIIYDGTNYWLFYGRSTEDTSYYGDCNPDDSNYVIYFKTAATAEGLAAADPQAVTTSEQIHQGQTSCVEYGGKIWVFGADSGDGGQVKAWTSGDGGLNWTPEDVLPDSGAVDPFTGSHLWATVHDGQIFLVVNRGGNLDVTSFDGTNWNPVHEAVNHEGLARLYSDADSGKLYLYYTSWAEPDAYEIYEYEGAETWTLVNSIAGTAPTQ